MLNRVLRRAQRALPSAPRRWLAEAAAQPPPPPRAADALAADHPLRLLAAPWLLAAVPSLALLVTVCGGLVLFGTYFVDSRVANQLSAVIAQNAVLSARMDGITSSVTKEVDTKTAGLASSITKEVDAKTAGLASEVDAKVAGVIAAAGLKADAATMRVLREYKVRGRHCEVTGGPESMRGSPPLSHTHTHSLPTPTPTCGQIPALGGSAS